MLKIIQTSDKSLPRRQEGWRNSSALAIGGAMPSVCHGSSVSDSEIDQISNQFDGNRNQVEGQNCRTINKGIITDVRQFEIDQYMKGFIKQNGSIISKDTISDTKKSSPKILLG